MSHSIKKVVNLLSVAFTALLLTACNSDNSSGGSGSGSNANYPGSIVGERIEFTVTERVTDTSVNVGLTVVYDFSSNGRVQGTNPSTGQVLEPARYRYTANGNNATILLYYEYSSGTGYEEYRLTGDGSIMQGSYEYEALVTSPDQYSAGKARGTYRIVPPNNLGVYQAPNAEDISPEQEDFWRNLTRMDDIGAIATQPLDAYVAVMKDGTLVTDILSEERKEFHYGKAFIAPPSGKFVAVSAPGLFYGQAISENGELWIWGGDSGLSPRIESNLDLPVHGFINPHPNSVITGSDRSPEYLCRDADGKCDRYDSAQANLDALNITDMDQAISTGASLLYTDINDGLLRLGGGCTGCSTPPAIVPGLGSVIDFDLAKDLFVVAIESTGQVIAWNWNGTLLPIPEEVGDNAANLAISGNHIAVVHDDGDVVVWRYDMETNKAVDVQVPSEHAGAREVQTTSYDGHFLFLR